MKFAKKIVVGTVVIVVNKQKKFPFGWKYEAEVVGESRTIGLNKGDSEELAFYMRNIQKLLAIRNMG